MLRTRAWVVLLLGSLAACGQGPVGTSSHPSEVPSTVGMKTWWGPGFAFQASEDWDVWSYGGVVIQGGFQQDGSLPSTFDVALRLGDTHAMRVEGFLRDQPPATKIEVDGRRGKQVVRIGEFDDSSRWRYVAMVHVLLSDRQPAKVAEIDLVATDPDEGAEVLATILDGIEFDTARGDLPKPSEDPPPNRLGKPELEPFEVSRDGLFLHVPKGWYTGDSSDRFVYLVNFPSALRHYFARPGDAAFGIARVKEIPEETYRSERWVSIHDGPFETPAGEVHLTIDHGIPAAGGFCNGDEWLAVAYWPRVQADGYLAMSLTGCDVPGMRALLERILESMVLHP